MAWSGTGTAVSGGCEDSDVRRLRRYSYDAQRIVGYRALIGVPIVLESDLIGAISVGRNVSGLFADEEVELVETFADQAAIALANARLIDAVERQRTELSRFVSPQAAELISSKEGERLLADPPQARSVSEVRCRSVLV